MPFYRHIVAHGDDFDDADDFGSDECTCRRLGLGPNDPDSDWLVSRDCPIHGDDPDDLAECDA